MDALSIAALFGTAALFGGALLVCVLVVIWNHNRGLDARDDPADGSTSLPPD